MKTNFVQKMQSDIVNRLKGLILFVIMLVGSVYVQGQQVEIEWDGTEADVLRLIEGGTVRFAIEGHTASTTDRITLKIRGVDALTLFEGGTVRLEVVSIDNSADSVVVRLADGTLAIRDQKNMIISYFLGLPNGIQTLLDAGECPLKLLEAGATKADLYGKTYQGGLIFYLDDQDMIPGMKGLIAAPPLWDGVNDPDPMLEWGCFGTDLPAVPSVGVFPPSGPGAEIGDGSTNTTAILSVGNCPTAPAAMACTNYMGGGFADWFLASAKELNLMWENLADSDGDGINIGPTDPNNLGGFASLFYWSSTEGDAVNAWLQGFASGIQNFDFKFDFLRVRPVRAF